MAARGREEKINALKMLSEFENFPKISEKSLNFPKISDILCEKKPPLLPSHEKLGLIGLSVNWKFKGIKTGKNLGGFLSTPPVHPCTVLLNGM